MLDINQRELFVKKNSSGNLYAAAKVALAAGTLMMASVQAQATSLNWSDLSGGATGPFILLDKLNTIASPQLYFASHNLAAGGNPNVLDNGDSFTETLTLLTNSSSLGTGNTAFGLGGDYRFDVSITGHVTNAIGTPITLNADSSVSSDATSKFDVVFDSATIGLFNNATNDHIANLTFLSGGASNVQLIAGSFIGDITLNTLLGGAGCVNCDPYIRNNAMGSITGTESEFLAITTGSSRFLSFNGSDFATHTLIANFQDNGQSTTFIPEPGSLALLGVGLLGLGVSRRTRPD
ncbi:MAG: hypothetical protein NTAFB09_14650 [Nitrosospira sp.]